MATKMYMAVYFTFGMTSLVLQVGMLCTTCSTVQLLLARPASRHLWSCKWVVVAQQLRIAPCSAHLLSTQRSGTTPRAQAFPAQSAPTNLHWHCPRHCLWQTSTRISLTPTWLLLQIIRSLLLVLGSFSASKKLHRNLLARVMHLPMSFFDSQPTGRLLNRWAHPLKSMPFLQIAHKQDIKI